MTISYTNACSTVSLGNFLRLLFRWKGSVYKIIYKQALIFVVVYYSINLIYWQLLNNEQKIMFEKVAFYFSEANLSLPLTFLMGFFVSQVANRWISNFKEIVWIDSCMIRIASFVEGNDERGRLLRRTLARYVNLSCIIVLRDISTAVKKRFPTLDHLVKTGIITEEESHEYIISCKQHPDVYLFWLPIEWAINLVAKARKENRILCDLNMSRIIRHHFQQELLKIRQSLTQLTYYSWISLPLVYTQVVTIATESYFLTNVIARQYTQNQNNTSLETVFPATLFLEFLFYVGWLKVAEVLIVPYGEDDDDFEVNYIIKRNLQVSYLMVDDFHDQTPSLTRDKHWTEQITTIPDTVASMGLKRNPFVPSTADLKVPQRLQSVVQKPSTFVSPERLPSIASIVKKISRTISWTEN
ncbi:Bestrophin-1 [Trichinella nativa]|uniref:Bestrophin homolog n=1 Tax=Trichinella nativa TaxID=6335 RepID=A0A0V1LG20_9BILA|nr:Bestrophin-1 [Trichinella sp. T6]KRZ58461.1 Bestrophin-1 [Trichinella nativa]